MIKPILHILLFFILSLSFVTLSRPQGTAYSFDRLSLEDGLSQSTVSCIFQDKKGFLWFGTANGLNKYDGYNFTVYKHDPEDMNSLSNDVINSITEDKKGMLWIGTEDGINRFDPVSEKFTRIFSHEPGVTKGINSLAMTEDDNIWIGTMGSGLNEYNPNTGKITAYINDPSKGRNSSLDYIRTIISDKAGNLWLATMGGLVKFDLRTKKFHNFKDSFLKQVPDLREEVYAVTIDTDGIVWFTTDGSLNRFDQAQSKVSSFIPAVHDMNTYFRTWNLLNDSRGNIWMGTGGMGILLFSKKNWSFTTIQTDPSKSSSLLDNSIMCIYEDRGGVVWIGTLTSGINKYIGNKNKFKFFKHDQGNDNSITRGLVYGIVEDKYGYLWIGTTSGLNKIDKSGKVVRYVRKPGCSNCLTNNIITDLAEDKEGNVWITTQWGLNMYDRKRDKFETFQADGNRKNWLHTNSLSDVFPDDEGNIWIGTFNRGMEKFNTTDKTFIQYAHNQKNNKSLSSDRISCITEDNNGNLLIGTSNGLNVFDKKSGEVIKVYKSGKGAEDLNVDAILSVYCDDDGIIWMGMYGGGLNRLDRLNKKVESFSENKGLPNNVVYGILPDESGNLWLSTNKGLVKFNKSSHKVRVYDPSDGLQSYEFNSNSYFRSRSGEMFFGGVNGYNSFYPVRVNDNTSVPPVAITSVKTSNKVIFKGEQSNSEDAAGISYSQNFITFDFVSLDYTNPARNKYSYKLEGFDKEWIDSGIRRFAVYTNLEPGEYTFRVKGSNSDEVWNQAGTSFRFIIHPPFWRTWWFYSLSVLFIIGAIISVHKYRVRMKLRQLIELEKMRKKIADDFHDELGHKLTKISLYTELMKQELSNAHIEPAEIEIDNEDYLQKINNAANSLFDDTKDFIWSIDPVKDTLYDLAVYLKDFGDEFFDRTGIAFRVNEISTDLSEINLPMDWKRQLILIFKEAMNNCLRHSESKNVGLSVAVQNGIIEISLRDDGTGFYGDSKKGRGINNMKSRAVKLNANLILESAPDSGTAITFTGEVPLGADKHKQKKQR